MTTIKVIKINPQKLEKKKLNEVINFLKKDKVIIFPTDTIYGLIGDATNKETVRKVFQIKKRFLKNPIPVFVKDIKMAKKLARINKEQESFLKMVWPGKVTIVLKRKKTNIKLFGIDRKTIALRIPNYKLTKLLLEKTNKPLVGTSANISGQPPSGNIKRILRQFKNRKYQPDLIIDAGNLPKSKPSTVIDLTSFSPKIIRP